MKLYNSLTREKEEFTPIEPGVVRMYSCGPTVYNYFHIGNARPFIIFDTLRRYLEYQGNEVRFVQNFTDVDDKMINRANDEGITVKELADRYIAEYFVDAEGLGIERATVHPRATEEIDAIIALIQKLEERGYAYVVDGDVYFSVKKFKEYGKLSHQPLENLEAGARIDVDEKKQDPMDFAVWKAKKEGEPAWPSPWGEGRPGWHIECSAMANKYLGKTIDIHSGGKDLIFPHHENEVAQSEAANDAPFAHYWLHNGYINVDNRKMSKSLGNFFTVRDVAAQFEYEVIRFFMLSAHYRSPINFSQELLEQAKAGLERLYTCLENLTFLAEKAADIPAAADTMQALDKFRTQFCSAMDDDINTADAIAALFDLVYFANTELSAESGKAALEAAAALLRELGGVLGLLKKQQDTSLDDEVEALIAQRNQARKDKDFQKADAIRDQLKDMGIVLEDTAQGVKWRRA